MSGPANEQLVRNMDALTAGLERIAKTYEEHVVLVEADPVTFGSGHFVFYPEEGPSSRFAIEEQYTGTDWSDPDRIPTSWTWRAESLLPHNDGTHIWVTGGDGEIQSDEVAQLITLAETWADTTHRLAARAEALTPAASPVHGTSPTTGPRTYLA